MFTGVLLQNIILKIKSVSKVKITLNNFELFTVSKHGNSVFLLVFKMAVIQ